MKSHPLDAEAPTVSAPAEPTPFLSGERANLFETDPNSMREAEAERVVERDERYRVGDLLGSGGMGAVLLCRDRRIGREVALKRMHQKTSVRGDLGARFMREARVQGQLEHPAVVPVYDLALSSDGEPYFTMRRVQGNTLAQLIWRLRNGDEATRERWSQRRLLSAFVQVCLSVHYAHTKGVLHRDLKPANVMLGDFGEVYVLDWGLARLLDDAEAEHLPEASPAASDDFDLPSEPAVRTRVGSMMGTPAYMSPEQFDGAPDVDARADVYALGLILYEILALAPLHRGLEIHAIREETLRGVDARPSRVLADVPPELDDLCAQATAREPGARTATARALAEAVERYLDGARDVERRREMAAQAARRAQAALNGDPGARGEDGDPGDARTIAMREVVHALALDPEQVEARRTMVELLTGVPAVLPAAVRTELEDERDAARRRALRLARWAWASWLFTLPAAWALGVRSVPAFAAMAVLVAAGTLLCFDAARRPRVEPKRGVAMAVVTASLVSGLAMWLGPFVLLPVAASGLLMMIVSESRPRERKALFAIALAVVSVPLLLEWSGVIPPSYRFEEGRLVLLARATDLRPHGTLAMLVWSSLAFVLVPSFLLARLRDQLDAAQLRLALQSWQLRQLGGEAPSGGAKREKAARLEDARP
jgi:serine/threonine-protein kinase